MRRTYSSRPVTLDRSADLDGSLDRDQLRSAILEWHRARVRYRADGDPRHVPPLRDAQRALTALVGQHAVEIIRRRADALGEHFAERLEAWLARADAPPLTVI